MGETLQERFVLDPEKALEEMAELFYEKRAKEAFKAAEQVLSESAELYSSGIDASDFIDLVITSGYIKMRSKGIERIPQTEQQFQVEQDIAKFLDYFRHAVQQSNYIAEYLH